MKGIRLERINAEIKRVVSEVIFGADYMDSSCMVSVMRADTSADLSYSDIYFSIFSTDKQKQSAQFDALKANAGKIRHGLAAKMKSLRIVPELRIKLDTTLEYSEKINKIITGIKE